MSLHWTSDLWMGRQSLSWIEVEWMLVGQQSLYQSIVVLMSVLRMGRQTLSRIEVEQGVRVEWVE